MMCIGLAYTYHSSGQHAELADLGGPVTPGTTGAPAPISDDGQESDALLPAQHLVISFTGTGAGDRIIEVLDEQGRPVLVQQGTGHAGRTLIPVDVTGLAQGRYAVRVQEGGATRVSRFVRE
jgi:hypothetical protein